MTSKNDIDRFVNFIWAYTPAKLSITHTVNERFILVSIKDKETEATLKRKYSVDILNKYKDNLDELALNCSKEIKKSIYKEDNNIDK
jgi:hypothetical protein